MKTAVIYWSGTGNTEQMAAAVAEGAGAELFSVSDFSGDVADYDRIAFGCPSMGDEVLEESEFEPFFASVESKLSGKKIDLVHCDEGELSMELVDCATVVLGSSMVLSGPHPAAVTAAYLVNALKPKLRFYSIIGSYGWGDGQWMRDWTERAKAAGAEVTNGEGLIINNAPDENGLADCKALGEALVN